MKQNLECNNVVVLRNGLVGAVGCFNDKPAWLIFKSYINPIEKYNEELKHKNTNYDVMAVYDGSPIENVSVLFKSKYDVSTLDIIWERKE